MKRFAFSMVLVLAAMAAAGCAGVPVGAISWQAVPPAPAPTTEWVMLKGSAEIGAAELQPDGGWLMIGCENGNGNANLGEVASLTQAEQTIQASCGY